MSAFPAPTWLVGYGNMASAMVAGWRSVGLSFDGVTIIRASEKPVEGISTRTDFPSGEAPRLVVLGVKPQKLDEVAPGIAASVDAKSVILSMLAGVELASLRARFPAAGQIIRILPNLPVAIGQGVIPIAAEGPFDEMAELMRPLGMVLPCESELELAAIGAIAGAGPAYVARFADALAKAGSDHGATSNSLQIALQTLAGTALLMQATGEDSEGLVRRVASPGGTTQAGLEVLDRNGGLERLIGDTIGAAVRRGGELAAAASIDPQGPVA
jgi:pyrroline-5-carboxylate reductase